ncbi:NAD-dependent epimerase/dehydratase family protein [Arenibacter sp. BSSL-BM3]|uniref:NAD-dependent epimerase/dehydratase family protein n=1 Tax=Arenibacter arenosicollis TaxID=2762274 RepID=A0ABR7QHN4_9FLAO|nr:NAD-dependent epimerase/dehydratase family protein [Arenibacter arenosicollis]MBC8766711.1 NAD-dependent epimerase/dehydratase family protein [Arenibacter arenosicollis]
MENGHFKVDKKSAIILGATGLTGGFLLQRLLDDDRYEKIKIISRTEIGFSHPKLEEHIGDLLKLESYKSHFLADEVYCCIGTTKAKTPDNSKYKSIDFGIPVSAAKICRFNGIKTFLVISAMGANAHSGVIYNRLKGEMEEAVLNCKIPKTHILQPSLIGGKREEKRMGEWIAKQFMKLFNFLLVGPLEKFRSIHPEVIAGAMVWLANNNYEKARIQSYEIKNIYHKLSNKAR